MKKHTKTAIIGGGLTGLSAAFHLKQQGADFLLFEKEEKPGGLSGSFNVNKFSFDYTGHFLHLKTFYGRAFVRKLLKNRMIKNARRALVYVRGEYIPYPFQANYARLKDRRIAEDCKKGLEGKKQSKVYRTFEEWILGTSGAGIYKHFMRPYNEKLYQYRLDKMLPLGPSTYVPDIKKKKKNYGYNAAFYYPAAGGIEKLPEAVSEAVFDRTLLSAEVKLIDPKKNELIYGGNRKAGGFTNIISTLPLPELIERIKGAPANVKSAAKNLKYVSVFALNLGIGRNKINNSHWIYFPDKNISFYRVGFYSNVSKKLCPPWTSSLYAEVSIQKGKKIDRAKLVERIKKDLVKTGILKKYDSIIAEQPLFIKYAYVVFDEEYNKNMTIINNYLKNVEIISTGRYGAWNYSAMEDAILCGRDAAKEAIRL